MYAQDTIGVSVSQDFDKPICHPNCLSPAGCCKREDSGPIFNSVGFELRLGGANPGNLRICVDNPGDSRKINVTRTRGDALGDCDTFFRCLVRQHGSADQVANGPDAVYRSSAVLVYFNKTPLVNLKATSWIQQAIATGAPADSNDQALDRNRPVICALAIIDGAVLGGALHLSYLAAQSYVQPLPAKLFLRLACDHGIGTG